MFGLGGLANGPPRFQKPTSVTAREQLGRTYSGANHAKFKLASAQQ